MANPLRDFGAVIAEAISKEAARIQEREIAAAVKRFELDLRASVGQVAVQIADYYSVQKLGNELVIRVQIGSEE